MNGNSLFKNALYFVCGSVFTCFCIWINEDVDRFSEKPNTPGTPDQKPVQENTLELIARPIEEDWISDTLADFRALPESAFKAELKGVLGMPVEKRSVLLPLLFEAWAESAPRDALIAASNLQEQKDSVVSIVLASWVAADPEAAAKAYKGMEEGLFSRNFIEPWKQVSGSGTVAKALAQDNLGRAIRWSQSLSNVADKEVAFEAVFSELGRTDPGRALKLLEPLPEGERLSAMKGLAETWAIADLNNATDWINTLHHNDQTLVIPHFIKGIARTDPVEASKYIAYVQGNRETAIGHVVDNWKDTAPEEAANWLLNDLKRDEQMAFMDSVMASWTQMDPDAAYHWVKSTEDPAHRDIALEAYISTIANSSENHEALVNMAYREIENTELKQQALNRTFAQWARVDRESALGFAESSRWLTRENLSNLYFEINAQYPLN
ncbi:MAG: hypothetical protein ACPGN3_17660 [Opitutales bacterium]